MDNTAANAGSEPPLSEWDNLCHKLGTHPRDVVFWSRLTELAEESGDQEKVKMAYDTVLKEYPNTDTVQIAYIEHYLNPGNFPAAESLFKKFLIPSPFVELWKYYVNYIRRVNPGPEQRDTVRKAFDFALERIGQDNTAGEIWADYIQFVKSGEANTTWEKQQKMDDLRKIYQRALAIPLDNVEKLHSDFEAFESKENKITAKKIMAEISPSYVEARNALRTLRAHVTALSAQPTAATRFDLPQVPTFTQSERNLVGAWKKYLKWEESNPLLIEEEDKPKLIKRIQAAYRKAVVRMRFYSEIWYMAYSWTKSVGKVEDAFKLLKDGVEANPSSFILNFAYAEEIELRVKDGNYADVHKVHTEFLAVLSADLQAVRDNIVASPTNSQSQADSQTDQPSSYPTSFPEVKPPKNREFEEKRTEYGLAWIMYQRFARRAEGLEMARKVFTRARKDKLVPWQAYEAAALMEYRVSDAADRSEVPKKIFELALKNFPGDVDMVQHYLGFLLSINDEQNARALFEKVIKTFTPNEALPLWERWGQYQSQYSDLATSLVFEKRLAEVYPDFSPLKLFAQRHKLRETDAIASRDLGFKRVPAAAVAVPPPPPVPGSQSQPQPQNAPAVAPMAPSHKRPASPDYRNGSSRNDGGRDHHGGGPNKRTRAPSPGRSDRPERWSDDRKPQNWGGRDGGGGGMRDSSRHRMGDRDSMMRDEMVTRIPADICNFIAGLPSAGAFDGPVPSTPELTSRFISADIPSGRGPPPPRHSGGGGGGRPPPDYSPYQPPPRRRY